MNCWPGRPEGVPIASRSRWRLILAVTAALTLATTAIATAATGSRPGMQPRLAIAGVAQNPCDAQQALPVPAHLRGQFEPDSSILVTAGRIYTAPGQPIPPGRTVPQCASATAQADRAWLHAGLIPGATTAEQSMATRALLDLRLAVRPDGAVVAGWRAGWAYDWPRDSSWVAAALAGAGHPDLAYQVLRFLARVQGADGKWAARYLLDGSGPLRDGRPAELDADGWVPWAVWSWAASQHAGPTRAYRQQLMTLWPMVTRAADAAARSLTGDGLPGPAMDYWENSVQVTLGTAAPLLAGLRAAANLATEVGGALAAADGKRWATDASRLAAAISSTFGRAGYQHTPEAGSGADAAVTFLGPPFAEASSAVRQAARSAQHVLTLPGGGLQPGQAWGGTPGVAWTAETAFFALFDAGTGQHGIAAALLGWLAGHRTALGSLPEQVASTGQAASTAPLSWSDAATLLALLAQAGHLPTVAVPAPGR